MYNPWLNPFDYYPQQQVDRILERISQPLFTFTINKSIMAKKPKQLMDVEIIDQLQGIGIAGLLNIQKALVSLIAAQEKEAQEKIDLIRNGGNK